MARISETRALEAVERALELAPVIDGHNDWPWETRLTRDGTLEGLEGPLPGDTDLLRLRRGRVGGQFWSVFVEDESKGADHVAETLEQPATVGRTIRFNSGATPIRDALTT